MQNDIHRQAGSRRIAVIACLLLAFGEWGGHEPGLPLQFASQPKPVSTVLCPLPGALEGVDVSSYQGTIDWAKVAQAKTFAYTRVANGTTNDSHFLANFAGIKAAGMKAGGYLTFQPAQDPTQQADNFAAKLVQAGFAPGDLVPMFDVQLTGGKSSQEIAAALQTAIAAFESALHVTPGIYTSASFWDGTLGDPPGFSNYLLWDAHWGVTCPNLPQSWATWSIWQYTSTGSVTGISGNVCLDRSNGPTLPIVPFRVLLPLMIRSN
jgi:lysozyme